MLETGGRLLACGRAASARSLERIEVKIVEREYAVEGRVTRREVEGVIGSGEKGSIYAHSGTGGIDLLRR